jgi:hypothetical protein
MNLLHELIEQYSDDNRYTKNIKHNYIEPSISIDQTLFYRIDCLGGVPLVVFLYDLYGTEGIERYQKIKINHCLHINSGIYPLNIQTIENFCKYYIETLKNCTYIGCWDYGFIPELYLIRKYCSNKAVGRPYNSGYFGDTIWFNKNNWYSNLQGKKIIVISSHSKSMEKQWLSNNVFKSHLKKHIRYEDTGIELVFVKPPMSACGLTPHSSWLESLDVFKQEIDDKLTNFPFDLALVSCGSYSAPICNYIYSKYNKSVFYIGGALQLYFSIIGNRWIKQPIINEYWTNLAEDEIPNNFKSIENGCYF